MNDNVLFIVLLVAGNFQMNVRNITKFIMLRLIVFESRERARKDFG